MKVLLYSDGMDSWFISKLWKPDVRLYIDMHTRYSEQEKKHLPDDVQVLDLNLGMYEREDAIIPMRNMFLYAMASMLPYNDIEICLGATQGGQDRRQAAEIY